MGDMFVNREALDQVLSHLRINSSRFVKFGSGFTPTGATSSAGEPLLVPRDAVELQIQITSQSATLNVTLSDGQGTSPKSLLELGGTEPPHVVGPVFRLDVREHAGKTLKLTSVGDCAALVNFMGRGNH